MHSSRMHTACFDGCHYMSVWWGTPEGHFQPEGEPPMEN